MTDSVTRSDGPVDGSGFDLDLYQYEPVRSDGTSFQSLLDHLSAPAAQDRRAPEDSTPLPPLDPPSGDDRGGGTGAAPSIAHRGACAVAGAIAGGAVGAVVGAVGEGLAGLVAGSPAPVIGNGTLALLGAGDGAWKGALVGSAAGGALGAHLCGGTTSPAAPAPQVYQSVRDPGRTEPTGAVGGTPTGPRSTSEPDATPERKAQVDSENQVADKLAASGYRVVQNPTEGPSPALTPERMVREGLKPVKNPDLLIEDRVFDTYTPTADSAASVRNGIEAKVEGRQTQRVVVDLRQTTQTEASLRSALKNEPIAGLKEVIVLTNDGLGRPFRP